MIQGDAPSVGPGASNPIGPPPDGHPYSNRPRRTVPVVAAVAIVVAVVLAGLYLAGVGPFHRAAPASPGADSFSQAEASGATAVHGYDGGGWSLIAAASAGVRQSESVPLLSVELALRQNLGSCALQWLTSATSMVVPGFSGNPDAGLSPFWVLVYRNASASGPALLFVTVSNGTPQLTALLPSTGACATYDELASFVSPISASVVDSPQVVSAAVASGGHAFLVAHPEANVTMEIAGSVNLFALSQASDWAVTFSTCPAVPGATGFDPQFNATVNAATGTVISEHTGLENCSSLSTVSATASTYSLSTSLSFSTPTIAHSGSAYWTNATVLSVAHGIGFGNLSISVSGPSGIRPTPAWDLEVVTAGRAPIAVYNLSTTHCISGCSNGVQAGDVLSVFSDSASLSGGSITLIGVGQWVGVEPIVVS